jgi:hypothetical protein
VPSLSVPIPAHVGYLFWEYPLGQRPLHRCKDADGVPTGLGYITCGRTFDLKLDLVAHGWDCAIWGSGPRSGAILAAMLEDPEFLNKAAAYAIEEEHKHKLLQEWRKQQELEEGDNPQEQP